MVFLHWGKTLCAPSSPSSFYVCNILASTRYYLTMSTSTCLRAGKSFRLNSNESEHL